MTSGGSSLPNHIQIELLSDQDLDRWCNSNGENDDNVHSRVSSIVVGGAFLHSLLDSATRFPAVVALEVRGEVPVAPLGGCTGSFPSPWRGLQLLAGSNDALCHIRTRKLLKVRKLVIRLALNALASQAPTTFRHNVAAFQPDTLAVQLVCAECVGWRALEGLLAALFTVDSLLGVRGLYVTLSLPADIKDVSGPDIPDNSSPDMCFDNSRL